MRSLSPQLAALAPGAEQVLPHGLPPINEGPSALASPTFTEIPPKCTSSDERTRSLPGEVGTLHGIRYAAVSVGLG